MPTIILEIYDDKGQFVTRQVAPRKKPIFPYQPWQWILTAAIFLPSAWYMLM